MKKTYYILQEIGYEYNDEIYYANENSGGTPQNVFLDKNKAKQECLKLNCERLKHEELGCYGYGWDEVFNDVDLFTDAYEKAFNKSFNEDDREFSFPPSMTIEQYKQIEPFLRIKFFEVVECQGE